MSGTSPAAEERASLPEFFWIWAELKGWKVPDIHWRAVHWLEHRGRLACLRCFRGFGKSTILAVYNAWCYYDDASYRILHQGDQDKTAHKTSRDTKAVLLRHPLTKERMRRGMKGEASFWWVPGADDERNPSMQAAGITSNITSSRCDEAQNDDVEVPRNITNPENREKMRQRLGEQTHIMVPGARQLYVGTPHTHDSLYDEVERMGADCLTIQMFEHEFRIERATERRYLIGFRPEMAFAGIGDATRLLEEGKDYRYEPGAVVFPVPPAVLVDFYAGHAWPERFDGAEMLLRRTKCRTVNEWDSQYQLHSRPIHETRLDPDRMVPYAVEPTLRRANGEFGLWLGYARIVGAVCRWDPSSGKTKSDVSALAVVLNDEAGNRYWHRAIPLIGDVAVFDTDGKTIIGGQVHQIVDVVQQLGLRRVTVENNGVGTFAPVVLKAALKQRRVPHCGVSEVPSTTNKNRGILEAFEGPLSSGKLWAHTSVTDGPAYGQMREFNPAITEQTDDYIDAAAKALAEAPERIGAVAPRDGSEGGNFAGWNRPGRGNDDWRPSAGVHEVELES